GPDDQRYAVDWIVAHEGVVAGHLAAVKIQTVGPKRHLSDPIPVFPAERLAWILRFRAVEPSALIVGIENFAAYQLPHPVGEIIGGGEGTPRRPRTGRGVPCVRVALGRARPSPTP